VALNAAPFVGRYDPALTAGLLLPVLLAGAVVAFGPVVAQEARFAVVAGAAGVGASLWAVALAASGGWDRVTAPLATRHEYEPFATTVVSLRDLFGGFDPTDASLPIHVRGHPPGAVVPPWLLDRLGLGGAGWFALLALAGWGLAVGAALVAARTVAGESAARRAAPALVLLPGAVWAGTSADALFAGVLALGVLLAVQARHRAAVGGGAVLGAGLLLTYGGTLVLGMAGLHAVLARRWLHAALIGAGAATVLLVVWAWSGFWWLDGLAGTREAYWSGVAASRPGLYLTVAGNPAAFAVAAGPAVLAGLWTAVQGWRLPASRLPLLGLLVVVLADLSQMSRGEVERIWLVFLPWVALAAPGHRRSWLAAQAVVAIGVQVLLRSPW
ncbi:MAG: hypothetical protein ACSLFP_18580, partial [Acidimicrobiales bacterium]